MPVERKFKSTVDGRERTFTLQANLLCPKNRRDLIACALHRVTTDISELAERRSVLPDDVYSESMRLLVADWNEIKQPMNVSAAYNEMLTSSGVVVIVQNSVLEANGDADMAQKIVDGIDNEGEFLNLIGDFAEELQKAVGNSDPPSPSEAGEKSKA